MDTLCCEGFLQLILSVMVGARGLFSSLALEEVLQGILSLPAKHDRMCDAGKRERERERARERERD